jgi:hypothetical protein
MRVYNLYYCFFHFELEGFYLRQLGAPLRGVKIIFDKRLEAIYFNDRIDWFRL